MMRARKLQVSRPVPVEGKGEVPTTTVVGSLSYDNATVSERHVPDGAPWGLDLGRAEKALAAMTGMSRRYRQVAELRDGLNAGCDPTDVLRRVLRREPAANQVEAATAYVDARCGHGPYKPAACWDDLLAALGLAASAAASKQLTKRASRRRRRAVK